MFCCPICYEAMSDPVVLVTGHTYDRDCITRWIGNGHKTCPVTGVRLRHLELMPNYALRNAVRVRPQTRLASLHAVLVLLPRCDTHQQFHARPSTALKSAPKE